MKRRIDSGATTTTRSSSIASIRDIFVGAKRRQFGILPLHLITRAQAYCRKRILYSTVGRLSFLQILGVGNGNQTDRQSRYEWWSLWKRPKKVDVTKAGDIEEKEKEEEEEEEEGEEGKEEEEEEEEKVEEVEDVDEERRWEWKRRR
ncbi:hypothetical protein V1478_012445 [Vespula squamosa]|uniref:Uncharacterized protein n=1 Tax=Vespula squamosa TaxID=30214 RepID=A0ABD2AD70_VESSQ